jgi:hypothetical protein
MLDAAAVEAQLAALGGETDKDTDADSDSGADNDAGGDGGGSEAGGLAGARDSDDDDDSSEQSDAAAEVAAARAVRSERRDNEQFAVLQEREAAAHIEEGGVNAQGRSRRRREVVKYSEGVQSQRYFAKLECLIFNVLINSVSYMYT